MNVEVKQHEFNKSIVELSVHGMNGNFLEINHLQITKEELFKLGTACLQAHQDFLRGCCEDCRGPLDELAIREYRAGGAPEEEMPRYCGKCIDLLEVEHLEARHDG